MAGSVGARRVLALPGGQTLPVSLRAATAWSSRPHTALFHPLPHARGSLRTAGAARLPLTGAELAEVLGRLGDIVAVEADDDAAGGGAADWFVGA